MSHPNLEKNISTLIKHINLNKTHYENHNVTPRAERVEPEKSLHRLD